MLGTWTRGGRKEGTDESTELWWHPIFHDVYKGTFCWSWQWGTLLFEEIFGSMLLKLQGWLFPQLHGIFHCMAFFTAWHFSLHGCLVVFSSKEPVLPIKWGHEGAHNGALSVEKFWARLRSWRHLMGRIWARALDQNPGIANLVI